MIEVAVIHILKIVILIARLVLLDKYSDMSEEDLTRISGGIEESETFMLSYIKDMENRQLSNNIPKTNKKEYIN